MEDQFPARQAADTLARLLADQRGTETVLALQRFGAAAANRTPGPSMPSRPSMPSGPAAGRRPRFIGVWEIVDTPAGPGLRRRSKTPLWESSVWSAEGDVPGKGDARRVIVLGESVARGYLLDPVFTPTAALRHYLDARAGAGSYQCVDLAQVSIRLPALRLMVRNSRHLDPDVLVVFAGNNWTTTSDDVPRTDYPADIAEVLRRHGYAGLRDALLKDFVLPQAAELLQELVRLRDEAGVQPVFVLPEFNLSGWSALGAGVAEIDVPMLPDVALMRWYEARAEAVAALAATDWPRVRALAEQMAELDQGTSPVPGFLLGRALEAAGEPTAAREAYERARDSVHSLPVKHLPRISRAVQDFIRDFCRSNEITLVDLTKELGPEGLPDPRHFLDYCHMSLSGITIAMAKTAEVITGGGAITAADAVGAAAGAAAGAGAGAKAGADAAATAAGSAPALAAVLDADIPGPEVGAWPEAVSLVLAGTYNSFSGQPAESVAAYLRRALEVCPEVKDLMIALGRLLDRPGGPLWSGADFAQVISEPNAAGSFERLGEYRPDKSRLWTLREAMAQVLGPEHVALTGSTGATGSAGGRRELLDIATTLLGVGAVPNFTEPRCYLQANTAATRITFALDTPADSLLRLTHRRREGGPQAAVVLVNGVESGRFEAVRGWKATEIAVPASALRPGANLVEIGWPGPAVGWETRIAEDTAALARGEQPYVLPIFGELFSVTIENAL